MRRPHRLEWRGSALRAGPAFRDRSRPQNDKRAAPVEAGSESQPQPAARTLNAITRNELRKKKAPQQSGAPNNKWKRIPFNPLLLPNAQLL